MAFGASRRRAGATPPCAFFLVTVLLSFGGPISLSGQTAGHGIAAANLKVVQNDQGNTTNSVTVSTTLSINGFAVRDGSNRGDYNVQVGPGFSDDFDGGILMASIAETGRDNGDTNYPGLNYCTPSVDYVRSGANAGAYFISTFNSPTGAEYNINISAAYFPYAKFIGGLARNSGGTNGGANDSFKGSAGLTAGTHYIDNGGGNSTVDLTSLGIDSRTDGILLVSHGKNEDNFALSQVNSNNGTWTVYIKDNGTDAGSYEQDPVAFVYIPRTNTTAVSGRYRGDGTILMFSGATPQFSVTNIGSGIWRLTIPGQTPNGGVLIVSPEGGLSQNQDNIVNYRPDGDGWVIQSRDMPQSPPTLQTPGSGLEPVASFVFIPAAAVVSLISPADNAQNVANVASLKVAVTNSAGGPVTIRFYGRPATMNPADDFEIIALPDTQFYVSSLNGGVPEMFYSQAEWIITNRVSRNIAYVAQLGDITQNGDIKNGGANTTEWRNATNAMYRVENPTRTLLAQGIPYGVAVGNHDEEPIGDATGTTTFYNQYFGTNHFTGRSYYAGHYGTNNNNHFDFFSAGGMDFIVLYFEFDNNATPAVLAWGNEVLKTNANRRAIIVTHNFGNTSTPLTFSAQGLAIYNALKTNANVFMMLAGHVTGQGSRVDTFNGNTIHTFVSDYQGWTNGGNGFLRIIDFSPSNNVVVFQTYSPWTGEYNTDPGSELFFSYDMHTAVSTSNNAPYLALGTNVGVLSGAVSSVTWSNLQSFKTYEWYVTVTDGEGNVTMGPTWRFNTAPNSPPVVSNALITIYGDATTNLNLVAYDANGDALTFKTNALPIHGMIKGFVAAGGAYTYVPARGFRGNDRFSFSANDGQSSSSVATLNLNVIAPPDSNGNGLPDWWEAAYGITDPNGDADGDGQSNIAEYLSGTNPTNSASVFNITSTTIQTNGHVTLKWSSVGGTRYRVQYADGPANASNLTFNDIARPLATEQDASAYGTPAVQVFTDDFTLSGGAPTSGSRFYRIRIVQ